MTTAPNPYLQSLYGAARDNISQEPQERGLLFTCMDPRLNHMLSMVWGDQFTIRHAGGFIPKPGASHNIDNAFTLAIGAGLNHVIAITHTDCLAVQTAKPNTHIIDDKTITHAWNSCENPDSCPEQVADKALALSINHTLEYGWEAPVYGLKCDSHDGTLSVYDPAEKNFILPSTPDNTYINELSDQTGMPLWLLLRITKHNLHSRP